MTEENRASIWFVIIMITIMLISSVSIYCATEVNDRSKAAVEICSPFAYDSSTSEYVVCKSSNPLGYEIRLLNKSNF